MKQSATVVMAVLTVCGLASPKAVYADSEDMGYWPYRQPIIKENMTEIGLEKYLGGATLLLLLPGMFEKYWPDYGYAWMNAESPGVCEDILDNEVWKNADIGKVRLVTPKKLGNKGEFIGIDLTSKLAARRDVKERKKRSWWLTKADIVKDHRVTLENLCELIRDEEGRMWLQAAVAFAHDNVAIGLPSSVTWKRMNNNNSVKIDHRKKYKPVWRGTIIEEADGASGKERWKLGNSGKAIAWKRYKAGKLKKAIQFKKLADKGVLEWSPKNHLKYYLSIKRQRDRGEFSDVSTLAVDDNQIMDRNSLAALENATELEILSEIDPDVWIERVSPADLWLITEYPIPSHGLEQSLRIQGYKHW